MAMPKVHLCVRWRIIAPLMSMLFLSLLFLIVLLSDVAQWKIVTANGLAGLM